MPFVYMDSDCEDEEFGMSFFGNHAEKKAAKKAKAKKAAKHAQKHGHTNPLEDAIQEAVIEMVKNVTKGAGGHAGHGHINQKKRKYIISQESFGAIKTGFAELAKLDDAQTMKKSLDISLVPASKKNKRRKLNIGDILGSLSSILSKGYRLVSIKKRESAPEHVWGTYICIFAARGHGKREKGAEMHVRHFTIHLNPVDRQHWSEYTPFREMKDMDKEAVKAAKAANRKIAQESDGKWHVSIEVGIKHVHHADSEVPTEAANAAGEDNTVAAPAATTTAPRGIASGIINLI
jgi:hypothetical protein